MDYVEQERSKNLEERLFNCCRTLYFIGSDWVEGV